MECLDQDVLDRLARDMGGTGPVSRVIAMYLGKLPAEAAVLHQRADAGDLASLGDEAHRFKSSTAMLGARRLAGVLAGIEAAAREGDAGTVAGLLGEFDDEAVRVERDMRSIE